MKEKLIPHIITIMAFVVFIVLGLACATTGSSRETLWNGEFGYIITGQSIRITNYRGDSNAVIPSEIYGRQVTRIGTNAFDNKKLTSVIIPEGVTQIDSSAFANNQLTSITIPSSVTIIDVNAFGNNTLTSVIIQAEGLWVSTNTFGDPLFNNIINNEIPIYLRFGTYELRNSQWYHNGTALRQPARIVLGTGIYVRRIDGKLISVKTKDGFYLPTGFYTIEVGYETSLSRSLGTVELLSFTFESEVYDITGKQDHYIDGVGYLSDVDSTLVWNLLELNKGKIQEVIRFSIRRRE